MAQVSASKWIPIQRDYEREAATASVRFTATQQHPLLPKKLVEEIKISSSVLSDAPSVTRKASAMVDDPLRMLAVSAPKPVVDDPLTAMLRQPSVSVATPATETKSPGVAPATTGTESKTGQRMTVVGGKSVLRPRPDFETWKEKTFRILTKYTTNKRIPVSANFLDDKPEEKGPVAVDRTKSRLEEITAAAAGTESDQHKSLMSQKEYISHIELQHDRLKSAWEAGERVLALKIAIQCAKLLGDTSVPQFYPSMFVLLTDILDTFGDLVFERIRLKGSQPLPTPGNKNPPAVPLPYDFRAADVSASAKETCLNWFYKTACIRELMPRLYIDMALIKCYRFLDTEDYPSIVTRLSRGIRGIGDPLSAAFARAYLSSKTVDIATTFSLTDGAAPATLLPASLLRPLLEAFDDFMFSFKHFKSIKWAQAPHFESSKLTVDEYIDLYSPAVEWLVQNIGYRASEDLFVTMLEQYKDSCGHSMVLLYILSSFDPKHIAASATTLVGLIKECEENSALPKSRLYLALGQALAVSAPPKSQRLPLLNDVWKVVTKIQDPFEYAEIAAVFIEYLLINFTDREVNIFLADVVKHVKEAAGDEKVQAKLVVLAEKTLLHSKDVDRMLTMDNFLPTLDLLENRNKVAVGRQILDKYRTAKTGTTNDPVVIHALFDIARTLHNSVDSLSYDDDRRQIAELIVDFIRKVDFKRDLEQQLNILVDCRAAFTSLDSVTSELVQRVALLSVRANQLMKGKHTKKTAAFVKACLAYCHITIPSLDDVLLKLKLFLECAQVALLNGMIAQGEGFLKAAVGLIPDVPPTVEVFRQHRSTEPELLSYIRSLASFLLLFPGNPQNGPFYLMQGLLNAVQAYPPWQQASEAKARVYMCLLQVFCAYAQRNFAYHVPGVESNDSLYGGDESYMESLAQFLETLFAAVLEVLAEIGAKSDIMSRRSQASLAVELANTLVSHFELTPHSATYIVRLFQLAKKQEGAADAKQMQALVAHVKTARVGAGVAASFPQDVAAKMV